MLPHPRWWAGAQARMRVYRDVVAITEHGPANHYQDGNDIEGWLLGAARKRSYGHVGDEIAR